MTDQASLLAKLPIKRRKFVQEILKDPENPARCYVKAGFSPKGAAPNAQKLLRNTHIAAAVAVTRAEVAITAHKKTVADILEIEERLTRELRGETYSAHLDRLKKRLERKERRLEALEKAADRPGLDDSARETLEAKIARAEDRIFDDEALIAQIHIAGSAESNKAAVTLLKSKGAFDPKRPPADDPAALMNELARNIIRSRYRPSQLIEDMKRNARDAAFAVRSGDVEADVEAPSGGDRQSGGGALFVRALPERKAT